jgi:hypothetical protein
MGQQQKHSIVRYLTVTKAAAASSSEAASADEQEPSSRPFKQPRLQTQTRQQQPQQVQQHKALRYTTTRPHVQHL